MTIAKDFAAKFAVAFVAVAMIFTMFSTPAQAQSESAEDLQALIDSLMSQIAALEGSTGDNMSSSMSSSSVCPYTWTRNLKMGSEGADVMKLQQFLNDNADTRVAVSGAGSAGAETMYYGPATAAAVSKFQVMYRAEVLSPTGLVNPTAYFGPSSRAKANMLCTSAPVVDNGSGEEVEEGEETEEETSNNGSVTLQGEGTLETFEIDDAEDEVQEAAEDEVVMEITAEAEDGDIEVARMTMELVANVGNEEVQPWDVFEEVSIWVDGDKVASFEADDEDNYLDEDEGTFRMSNLGLILEEDEEVDIYVAVSVMNSVDGADMNAAEWTIDVLSARTFDADGVADTDSFDEMDGAGITFDIVVEGVDDEAEISSNSSTPDSATLKVEDNTSESDEYVVHLFDIEVDEDSSDLVLDDAFVWVSVTNPVGNLATFAAEDVVADVYLTIDGKTESGDAVTGNEGAAIADGATERVGYRFEFDGLDLDADTDYTAEVSIMFEGADVVAGAGTEYDLGTGIMTDVDAQEAGAKWQVEGLDNDFVLEGDDDSETHTLNTVVPVISGVSVSESTNDDQTNGTVSFRFSVEADGENDIDNFTVANIVDAIAGGTLAPTPVLVKTSGDAVTNAAGDFTIEDGDEASFALTYTFTGTAPADNGSYFVTLESVLGVEVDETSDALDITGN